MNKQCAMYCIELIRCLMQEKPIPQIPEDVSLEDLYAFAKLHGVEAMVYHGLEQLPMDEADPVWKTWANRADLLLTQSMVQLAERDALFEAFPAAGIPILPVKGCWLKEQYPDIDYRQMSELDILIHPEDAPRAAALMKQLGYIPEDGASDHHDEYIKPPYMGVELQTALLPKDDERYDYYQGIWDKAILSADYPEVYRLKPEDEYLFFLVHLYKHVYYAGTGIRPFLDCVVYRKLWPDMDRDYLHRELETLGLVDFARQVENLSDCWFTTGEPVPAALLEMEESVISSAAYGTESGELSRKVEKLARKYGNRHLAQLVYWLGQLFAPLEEMAPQYPVLNKYPWLLPIFWFVHLVQKLSREPKDLLRKLRITSKAGK